MSKHSSINNGSRTSSRKTSQNSKTSLQKTDSSRSSKGAASVESEVKFSFLHTQPEVKPTLSDYKKQSLGGKPLFPKTLTLDSKNDIQEQKVDDSFLITGFGMRNLQSLQDALQRDEEKRLFELYKFKQKQRIEEEDADVKPSSMSSSTSISSSKKSTEITRPSTDTETETPTEYSNVSAQKRQLEYLMGLQTAADEEDVAGEKIGETVEKDQFAYSTSLPMRNAQKYLRLHRIFDFFQFITAHLLQASPDNPIEFILDLLNKSLLYRSGHGEPPLLYERKHITQLFCLMDRLGSGTIDTVQYKKGMATLGVCEYNKYPRLTHDGMVERDTFIEEAYDAELALFQDLIGRKWMGTKMKQVEGDKVVVQDVVSQDSGPYFIPSELFKSFKKEKAAEVVTEEEEFYDLTTWNHRYRRHRRHLCGSLFCAAGCLNPNDSKCNRHWETPWSGSSAWYLHSYRLYHQITTCLHCTTAIFEEQTTRRKYI